MLTDALVSSTDDHVVLLVVVNMEMGDQRAGPPNC